MKREGQQSIEVLGGYTSLTKRLQVNTRPDLKAMSWGYQPIDLPMVRLLAADLTLQWSDALLWLDLEDLIE